MLSSLYGRYSVNKSNEVGNIFNCSKMFTIIMLSFLALSLHNEHRNWVLDSYSPSYCFPSESDVGYSAAVDCLPESHRNSLTVHGVGGEEDHSSLNNSGASTGAYNTLRIEDVSPIESARARFLQIVVDYFIMDYVIEVANTETDYTSQSGQVKLSKRKKRDVQYEGDPAFVLPLMFIANMYERLVNDVNLRLASLNGIREKTIGVALEAKGGLYRYIAKKFPQEGSWVYKKRELGRSLDTLKMFPELEIPEGKRVRIVVINGLKIVEKPTNIPSRDAEWFKRLTGRNEVNVAAQDYKFYFPRHKYKRVTSSLPATSPAKFCDNCGDQYPREKSNYCSKCGVERFGI